MLVAGGVAAIAGVEVIARRSPGQRIGRTLAAARDVSIDEALRMAESGDQRYVRVHGRISSDEEFPDEHDRPLVYRRKRIEVRQADGRWQAAGSETEGVPFGIESRDSFIAVDSDQLAGGLIVVPRQADGVAADLPADYGAPTDPQAPTRLVVEQVSAVEHATVAGVPVRTGEGSPAMSSGLGRPLILTTLEVPDAMRLLGKGRRRAALASGVLVVVGLALIALGVLLVVVPAAHAQSPTPAPLPTPFDPRGGGVGPGVVGAPFIALLAVIGLGVLTALVTALFVRLGRAGR